MKKAIVLVLLKCLIIYYLYIEIKIVILQEKMNQKKLQKMYNFNKSTRKYIFFFIHYLILDIVDVMALE